MSTPDALAAVTAVLRSRLTQFMADSGVSTSVGNVAVTARTPDRIVTGAQETNAVNLFLHRVTRNQGWANNGPPPRTADGDRVANPPVGVDLHYVVSAYGQNPFTPEILLGHAVTAFHDQPVLDRAGIRRALSPTPPDASVPASLASSRLAEQLEQLRIVEANPGTEEISRLWSSFQAPYRPSAFYDVSVVLMEPPTHHRDPFPVLAVGSAATAVALPTVDTLSTADPDDPNATDTPITVGSTLYLTGRNLSGDGTLVHLGGSTATPDEERSGRIEVALSAFAPPVRPGLAGLVVTHERQLGVPPTSHVGVSSDVVPAEIHPTITITPADVTVTDHTVVDTVSHADGTISVGVAPRVGRHQAVVLLLAEAGAPTDRPARGASLPAPVGNGAVTDADDSDRILFPFTRVPVGTYVARLQVDGVSSPVAVGVSGHFETPSVVIP